MILQQLKEQTRPHHIRVEKSFDLNTRLAGIPQYRDLLERLLSLYAPLEDLLASIDLTAAKIDFPSRRKTFLLEKDLAALGMDSARIAAIPRCPDLPQITILPQALGCMYVLEGATLGGQIIRRLLHERFSLEPQIGAAFFTSYGENVPRQWTDFCTAITSTCTTEHDITQAIAAAIQTFECFERQLVP